MRESNGVIEESGLQKTFTIPQIHCSNGVTTIGKVERSELNLMGANTFDYNCRVNSTKSHFQSDISLLNKHTLLWFK